MEASSGWLDPKQPTTYGAGAPVTDDSKKRKFRAGLLWTISGVSMLVMGSIRAYFYFQNIEETMTSSRYRFTLPTTLALAGLIALVVGIKLMAMKDPVNKKYLTSGALVGVILLVGYVLDVFKAVGDPRPFSPVFVGIEILATAPVFIAAMALTAQAYFRDGQDQY